MDFQSLEIQANAMLLKLPEWLYQLNQHSQEKFLAVQKELQKESRIPITSPEDIGKINSDSVTSFIRCLADIFHLFGMKKPNGNNKYSNLYAKSMEDSILLYKTYSERKGPDTLLWKDLCKWKTCAFFSVVFHQDLPPIPKELEYDITDLRKPRFLLCGVFKVYLKHILSSNRETLKTFALTILQSKKGAPALSKTHIQKARFKTYKVLTTPPLDDDPVVINFDYGANVAKIFDNIHENRTLDEPLKLDNPKVTIGENILLNDDHIIKHRITKEWVQEQLRRTVREVFGRTELTADDVYAPIFPSTSANYHYSRDGMGAVGNFYRVVPEAGRLGELLKTDLGHMNLEDKNPVLYGQQRKDEEILLFDIQKDNPLREETLGLLFDPSDIKTAWRAAYDKLWKHSVNEIPMTKTIGLPEPFKIRVITCGPPSTYTVLHSFQKFIFDRMKKFEVFELMGTPVTAENLYKTLGTLLPDEEYGSGDYEAATDNLKSWTSETTNKELFECLKQNNKELSLLFLLEAEILCERALTHHFIKNPIFGLPYDASYGISEEQWNFENKILFQMQRNGQLMGSIISFLYLCIINAALCRAALEIANSQTYSLKTVPLKVNGDDNAFRTKKIIGRLVWEVVTKFAGLKSSVGKTYFSDQFVVINSTHYDYNPPSWETPSDYNPLVERKYINMGLVYGQKKSGVRGKSPHVLGELHHELKRKSPDEFWFGINKLFLKSNAKALKEYKLPWYLPAWLGGLGLVRPNDHDSQLDRCVAHSIMKTLKNSTDSFAYDCPKFVSDVPRWRMFQFAQRKLKDDFKWLDFNKPYKNVEYEGTTRSLSEQNESLRKWKIIEELFTHDSGLPLGHTYSEPEKEKNKLFIGMRPNSPWEAQKVDRDLKHNERCWALHVRKIMKNESYHKTCFLNMPSYEDLETIKIDAYLPCFNNEAALLE